MFSEGNKDMRSLLGGKGANLAEMSRIGLNVPPGFTITTEACNKYRDNQGEFPDKMWQQVERSLKALEKQMDRGFGDSKRPLLLSVRSGAVFSMPGMMDTILNLGMNNEVVDGLAKASGDRRFALDCYRRLIQMFGDVVLGLDLELFERALDGAKRNAGVHFDMELGEDSLDKLVKEYMQIIEDGWGQPFPQDPMVQLEMSIRAVFDSWDNPRAQVYRQHNDISGDLGTAVNVQTMVFGNLGDKSATGVAFTRNPSTGVKEYYGEYLRNAQGEDVVAGIRTPRPVAEMESDMPEMFEELKKVYTTLDTHYRNMQDFEFTIQEGELFVLQTRNGKRSAQAAIKIATDMVDEGLIEKNDALLMIEPKQISQLLHSMIDPSAEYDVAGSGLAASPGAAVGRVVFTADDAVEWNERGEDVVLVRVETKPDDIHGFFAAEGILTARGGKTSHAAVVARSMGKPCVSGCEDMTISMSSKSFKIGDKKVSEGDYITIDGSRGYLIIGQVPTIDPELSKEAKRILNWADEVRRLGVWANSSTPESVELASRFGAEGIGLCRTERMFNSPERLPIVLDMILSDTKEEREDALGMLLPYQKKDFTKMFKAMDGKPLVIRLLDIPLHEFLPSIEELNKDIESLKDFRDWLKSMRSLSRAVKQLELPGKEDFILSKLSSETSILAEQKKAKEVLERKVQMLKKVRKLVEVNPMLGHRGVRLGITYPEIYRMQMKAICEASAEVSKEGFEVHPHVMIPQVCTIDELKWTRSLLMNVKEEVEGRLDMELHVKFGCMIEVVRACMRAGRMAEIAEFFSFGTNDLTQAVFSFSREDAENTFLPLYNERKILNNNPFEVLDQKGVGRLMDITVAWGRKTRPDIKIGVCGEHGGEPRSIGFIHTLDIDYVSCSPYRVPGAKIAAAQAALTEPNKLSVIYDTGETRNGKDHGRSES